MSNLLSALNDLKIQANGTDQGAIISTALASSTCAGLVFDLPFGSQITISTTLNANGKILKFNSGNSLTGTGTVYNAIYKFSNNLSKAFDLTINHTNVKVDTPNISVMVFGATGNGVTDDQPALQKASDTIIANPTLTRNLWFPGGNYLINNPWMLYYWDGSEYQQFTINIIGTSGVQGSNLIGFPRIICNYTDSFAIGVQRAYGGGIRGISVEGPWTCNLSNDQFYTNPTWSVIAPNMRDTQWSPSAGIVLDPFTGIVPADGGYPRMTSWYKGPSTASGLTGFNINEALVKGFTVGILNSPNGVTQQGEDCSIQEIQIDYCKVAIVYCQRQSDRTLIHNLRSWYYLNTIIDINSYGACQGTIAAIDGINVAGVVYQLFNLNCQKSLSIRNIYAENFFKIGQVFGLYTGVSIDSSNFEFYISPTNLQPDIHFNFMNVQISNSVARYYDDLFNKRLRGKVRNVKFTNTWLDAPPLIIGEFSSIYFNCNYENCPIGNAFLLGAHNDTMFFNSMSRIPVLHGKFSIQDYIGTDGDNPYGFDSPTDSKMVYKFDCTSFNRYILYLNNPPIQITPDSNRTCTIVLDSTKYTFQPNDYIFDFYTLNIIGRISIVNGNNITITEIPINIVNGTYYMSLIYWVYVTNGNFIGDLIAGSNIITNVYLTSIKQPVLGTRYEHPALPKTTCITAYDPIQNTVTISLPATKTMSKQNFINGNPEIVIDSYTAPNENATYDKVFLNGTVWNDIGSNESKNKWIFNKSGFLNSAKLTKPPASQADYYIDTNKRINNDIEYYNTYSKKWIDP